MSYTENEVQQALNELVETGKLHRIVLKDGTPKYVENTFRAGFEYALKEIGGDVKMIPCGLCGQSHDGACPTRMT